MPGAVEFWFEFASTYSYPAAMRVEALALGAGVELTWRPFLLGPIFAAQGWRDSPFNIYPAKGRYMWRDLERTCTRLGLPLARPSQFPRNGLLAARVATAAAGAPWRADFVRRTYRANFVDDQDIAQPAVVAALLGSLGLDADEWLGRATSDATKAQLRAAGDEAVAAGIFGAPALRVGDELFWGNDRVEEAIAWARSCR
jgi:2-hydroxychromene-2-carboxylate isomerase